MKIEISIHNTENRIFITQLFVTNHTISIIVFFFKKRVLLKTYNVVRFRLLERNFLT